MLLLLLMAFLRLIDKQFDAKFCNASWMAGNAGSHAGRDGLAALQASIEAAMNSSAPSRSAVISPAVSSQGTGLVGVRPRADCRGRSSRLRK